MKTFYPHSRRGSALITVMIFGIVLCILVGSIMAYVGSERRLNHRTQKMHEARMAAEALTEFGVSQIRQKFSSRSAISLGSSGTDALSLPDTAYWTGGLVQSGSLELLAGSVSTVATGSGSLYYIDPADPANERDPNIGKWVFRQDVPILSKATVSDPQHGGNITAYASQRLAIRAIPLFAHAVFYNMDMEMHPGPTMQILGPVHVNGSIYVSAHQPSGTTNTVDFFGPVSLTGNIYHAWKSDIGTAQGTGETLNLNAHVNFLNSSGGLSSMYDASSNKWMDSLMGTVSQSATHSVTDKTRKEASFAAYANARWGGKLLTSSHGVMPYDPPAIGTYAEDSTPTNGVDNSNNSGRQLIEPSSWPTDTSAADYDQQLEVEKGKFANDAGIYITVNPSTGSISAVSRSKNSQTPTKTLTLPSGIVTWNPYAINTSTNAVTGGMYDARRGDVYPNSTFDRDRNRGVSLVDVRVDKLKLAVDELSKTASARDASKAIAGLEPSDWTGIVYVEVKGAPTTNTDGTTDAATIAASAMSGVRLLQGSVLPSYGTANPGLTVATNVPMYVKGHYNADGTINTSTDPNLSSASKAETGEKPAALVADSITILSNSWSDSASYTGYNSSSKPTAAASVEISAAMLMGLTPTNKNGSAKSSGGLHNFPRFLENWGSNGVWIRGSLVGLFENRMATETWSTNYYAPPKRNWGFNSLFKAGIFPPGTPKVLSFKRTEYRDLTAAEYASLKSSYGW